MPYPQVRFSFHIGCVCALLLAGCAAVARAVPMERALVLTGARDPAGMESVIREVEAAGGRATHIFSHYAFIADLPSGSHPHFREPASVFRGPIGPASENDPGAFAVRAWNAILESSAASLPPVGPLANDALQPSVPVHCWPAHNGSHAPDPSATSYFLIGRVAVGIVFPESKYGPENWQPHRQAEVLAQIIMAMDWWAAQGGPAARLTFLYDLRTDVPCDYEPIEMSSTSHKAWVADVMSEMGYGTGDPELTVRAFDNDLRAGFSADWAFTAFVADSLVDTDGRFPDGAFAFSCIGGPYMVMTYDNGEWGIARMRLVAAHETGHVFHAGDEYCDSYYCCGFGPYGYLGVLNGNCEYQNPASVPCIMRRDEAAVCEFTRGQLGWRDSDSDGLPDPIDTTPQVTHTFFTQTGSPPAVTYSGRACDIPVEPASVNFRAVTINKIAAVEYRSGGLEWQPATADDGWFDSDVEDFHFTVPVSGALPAVEIRAVNTVGNQSPVIILGPGDVSRPIELLVTDEGLFTTNKSELQVTWHAEDPESGISAVACAVGATPGGTECLSWTLANNASGHLNVGNLSLASGGTYYVSMTARNGSGLWSEIASSDGITVVDTIGPAGARSSADGVIAGLQGVSVTAGTEQMDGEFYVETVGRFAGIGVAPSGAVNLLPGDIVSVVGLTATSGIERRIAQATVLAVETGHAPMPPLFLRSRELGGGDLNEHTMGVSGGNGVNNIGLLVSIIGRVTSRNTGDGFFYVDDGAQLADGSGHQGIRVVFDPAWSGFSPPEIGQMVRVTGISTARLLNGMYVRAIRLRDQWDVDTIPGV